MTTKSGQRVRWLTVCIIVIGFFLVLSSCVGEKTIDSGNPTLTQPKNPSITETVTSAVSRTPTYLFDTQTPTPRFTETRVPISSPTVTKTIQVMAHYYDSSLGITFNYPNTWKKVGYREFKGVDGYLRIDILPGYHGLSATHVCEEYFDKKFKGKDYSIVPIGGLPGCVIHKRLLNKYETDYEMQGVLKIYNRKTDNNDYLLLTSVFPNFFEIVTSLVYDTNQITTVSSLPPTPAPFSMDIDNLGFSETFLKVAKRDGEEWNTDDLKMTNERWDPTTILQCGETIQVKGHTLQLEQNYSESWTHLIEVKQDGKSIFGINIMPSPSDDVWAFCEWKGSWFLETSDFIVQDGEILNHKYGYDEMFGWDILAGKLFYFFTKNGAIYLSYGGKTLPIKYDYIPHYGCCEIGSYLNPHGSDNEVRFFGVRDGSWYFVDFIEKKK